MQQGSFIRKRLALNIKVYTYSKLYAKMESSVGHGDGWIFAAVGPDLNDMPTELLQQMQSHLADRDLLNLSQTSRDQFAASKRERERRERRIILEEPLPIKNFLGALLEGTVFKDGKVDKSFSKIMKFFTYFVEENDKDGLPYNDSFEIEDFGKPIRLKIDYTEWRRGIVCKRLEFIVGIRQDNLTMVFSTCKIAGKTSQMLQFFPPHEIRPAYTRNEFDQMYPAGTNKRLRFFASRKSAPNYKKVQIIYFPDERRGSVEMGPDLQYWKDYIVEEFDPNGTGFYFFTPSEALKYIKKGDYRLDYEDVYGMSVEIQRWRSIQKQRSVLIPIKQLVDAISGNYVFRQDGTPDQSLLKIIEIFTAFQPSDTRSFSRENKVFAEDFWHKNWRKISIGIKTMGIDGIVCRNEIIFEEHLARDNTETVDSQTLELILGCSKRIQITYFPNQGQNVRRSSVDVVDQNTEFWDSIIEEFDPNGTGLCVFSPRDAIEYTNSHSPEEYNEKTLYEISMEIHKNTLS